MSYLNPLQRVQASLQTLFEGHSKTPTITLDPCVNMTGMWYLDVWAEGQSLVLFWSPVYGPRVGVCEVSQDPSYVDQPNKLVSDETEAVKWVCQILGDDK